MDGDKILTSIMFRQAAANTTGSSLLASHVTVLSTIQSVASCIDSTVSVATSVQQSKDVFHVLISAFDMDGLPINYTVPAFKVTWDGEAIIVQRHLSTGAPRNQYVAVMPQITEISRKTIGLHNNLTVVLEGGWGRHVQTCVLESRTVMITADPVDNTLLITLLVVLLVVLLAGALHYFHYSLARHFIRKRCSVNIQRYTSLAEGLSAPEELTPDEGRNAELQTYLQQARTTRFRFTPFALCCSL